MLDLGSVFRGDGMFRSRYAKLLRKHRSTIFIVLVTIGLLCALLAAGWNTEQSIPVSADSMNLRLFGKLDKWVVFLLEDSETIHAYYKDTSDTDSNLVRKEGIENGNSFFLNDGCLKTVGFLEEYFSIMSYVLDSELEFEERGWCAYLYEPSDGDQLVFSPTEPDIYTMYILSSDGKLWSCTAFDEPSYIGVDHVEFLDSTQEGWIYAYADGTLNRWKGEDYADREIYPDAPCPEKLVGENAYVDKTGALLRIKNGVLEQVELEIGKLNPQACFGTDEYVMAADASSVIHKYDWSVDGIEEIEVAFVDGEIWGLVSDYALVAKEDQLNLTQLVFQEPGGGSSEPIEPSSTPTSDSSEELESDPPLGSSEEPKPDSTPDGGGDAPSGLEPDENTTEPGTSTPTPDDTGNTPGEGTPTPPPTEGNDEVGQIINKLQYKERTGEKGKYAVLLSGARVSDLRKIFAPQSIDVFTQDGSTVFDSVLKTGMKIRVPLGDGDWEDITVIIRGDCDGDGRVTVSDIQFASFVIIDVAYFQTEAQFIAADMNDDDEFALEDLPKIADEVKRDGKFR